MWSSLLTSCGGFSIITRISIWLKQARLAPELCQTLDASRRITKIVSTRHAHRVGARSVQRLFDDRENNAISNLAVEFGILQCHRTAFEASRSCTLENQCCVLHGARRLTHPMSPSCKFSLFESVLQSSSFHHHPGDSSLLVLGLFDGFVVDIC
jgi:hypothetical protein